MESKLDILLDTINVSVNFIALGKEYWFFCRRTLAYDLDGARVNGAWCVPSDNSFLNNESTRISVAAYTDVADAPA